MVVLILGTIVLSLQSDLRSPVHAPSPIACYALAIADWSEPLFSGVSESAIGRCKKKANHNTSGIKDLGTIKVSGFRDFPIYG
jgi:hypothetical protein